MLLVFRFDLSAQDDNKPLYSVTPKLHYGFIWDFAAEVAHLANQHIPGIALDVTKQTRGSKEWHRVYRMPQIGYSIGYYKFDPKKPIGDAFVAYIHAGKNIFYTKRNQLQWRIGVGGAFVNRRYDTKDNFKNNVISERVNFTLNGQLNYNLALSPSFGLNMGIGLLHISNGSLKLPNFGINLPAAHVGVTYNLHKGEVKFIRDSVRSLERRTYVHLSTFGGVKEVYPVNGPKYILVGVNALVERRMNRKSGLHAGLDLNYDHSKKSEIALDTIPVKNIGMNRAQASILLGHELYINKLSMITQFGIYVYDPSHINNAVYQKIGLKYYITEKVFTNITMKIHLGVADWIEWGIGVRL